MINHFQDLTTGGVSYILSSVFSIYANSQKHAHEKFMAASKYEMADVKDARSNAFPFVRRSIVLTLFPTLLIILAYLSLKGVPISIPVDVSNSYFFGIFSTKKTEIIQANGFLLMLNNYSTLMWAISGLYFGAKVKL